MPFQQLGFQRYPRNPKRDTSGYQDMGKGFADVGGGVNKMMGAFQAMKERRQANLMATQKHEMGLEEWEMTKADIEYKQKQRELEDKKVKEWEDYNAKIEEKVQKQLELAQQAEEAEKERQNKLEIEKVKSQAVPGATGQAAPVQTPASQQPLPTTKPYKGTLAPVTPIPPDPAQAPRQKLEPDLSSAVPTLEEYVYKAKALGRKVNPAILQMLHPKKAITKSGKWVPRTYREWQDMYLFQEENKAFAPRAGRGKGKIEDNPEFFVMDLEQGLVRQKTLKDEIMSQTPEAWKKTVFDFLKRPQGKELQKIERLKFMHGLFEDYQKNEQRLQKNLARYKIHFKEDFTVSQELNDKIQGTSWMPPGGLNPPEQKEGEAPPPSGPTIGQPGTTPQPQPNVASNPGSMNVPPELQQLLQEIAASEGISYQEALARYMASLQGAPQ